MYVGYWYVAIRLELGVFEKKWLCYDANSTTLLEADKLVWIHLIRKNGNGDCEEKKGQREIIWNEVTWNGSSTYIFIMQLS